MKSKSFLLLVIVLVFCFSQSGAQQLEIREITLREQADSLKTLYDLIRKGTDSDRRYYDHQFFEIFPKSFGRFDSLYGYHPDNKNLGVLLYESDNHIDLLYQTSTVPKEVRLQKIINIAFCGKWDADAIGYFQHRLRESVLSNLTCSLNILRKYSDQNIKGFWHFYFDGPHPVEKIPHDLEKVKSLNDRIYQLMKEAHQQVLRNNKHNRQ